MKRKIRLKITVQPRVYLCGIGDPIEQKMIGAKEYKPGWLFLLSWWFQDLFRRGMK